MADLVLLLFTHVAVAASFDCDPNGQIANFGPVKKTSVEFHDVPGEPVFSQAEINTERCTAAKATLENAAHLKMQMASASAEQGFVILKRISETNGMRCVVDVKTLEEVSAIKLVASADECASKKYIKMQAAGASTGQLPVGDKQKIYVNFEHAKILHTRDVASVKTTQKKIKKSRAKSKVKK